MNGRKILQAIEDIAVDKGINSDKIITAVKIGLAKTYNLKIDPDAEVTVDFNKSTGEIKLFQTWYVVEKPQDIHTEITLHEAQNIDESVVIGETISKPIPPVEEFNRIMVFTVSQLIKQVLQKEERDSIIKAYNPASGELMFGRVDRIFDNYILVQVNQKFKTSVIISRNKLINQEVFREGDRICFLTDNIIDNQVQAQLTGSRVANVFLSKLLEYEVPEIYNKLVEVKAVARNPGFRSKVAVMSHDPTVDPIGACIGQNGSRLRNISRELKGERIDLYKWTDNDFNFFLKVFYPVHVLSLLLIKHIKNKKEPVIIGAAEEVTHEDNLEIISKDAYVIVLDEQFLLALGRRGGTIRVISKLTTWNVHLIPYSVAMRYNIDFLWNCSIQAEDVANLQEKVMQKHNINIQAIKSNMQKHDFTGGANGLNNYFKKYKLTQASKN